MASHSFPSPPDLSELLKFFAQTPVVPGSANAIHKHQHASSGRHPRSAHAIRASSSRQSTSHKLASSSRANASTAAAASAMRSGTQRRRASPPIEPTTARTHGWNGSTQIQSTIAKPLKHQILDRTYQPPAPVVVDTSEATHLLRRLGKTTISSRLKRHPTDQAATLAAATAVFAGAFERRSQHGAHQQSPTQFPNELDGVDDNGDARDGLRSPPDSRARDGIQMLLMYRKEVEKRLSMDPTYFRPQ